MTRRKTYEYEITCTKCGAKIPHEIVIEGKLVSLDAQQITKPRRKQI